MSEARGRRVVRALAGVALSAALLVWIGFAVRGDLAQISRPAWTVRPGLLVASVAPLAVAYGLWVALWRTTLAELGTRLDARTAARAWMVSQLGKYVPGKVWVAVGRVALVARSPGQGLAVGLSIFYEMVLFLVAGVLLSSAALPPSAVGSAWPAVTAVLLGAAALVALLVPGAGHALARCATWLVPGAGEPRSGVAVIRPARLLALLGGYAASWLVVGAGFALFVASFHPIEPRAVIRVALGFVFAWAAGALVFLAPAGLGVREAALLVYLDGLVPRDVALVVVVASRLWTTGVELAGLLVAVAWSGGQASGRDTDASARA